jgi:hydroxyacylglutathione hydrolase
MGTNCYVVRAAAGARHAVVVDPSGNRGELEPHLESFGTECAAILVTHSHFDHVLGLADLAEASGAPVSAPEAELVVLQQPSSFSPPELGLRPWTPDVLLTGGERLELAGVTFDVLAVPGHSPGHLAFAVEGALLSGDVLFAGSVGRTDLPGGDWATLLDSIGRLVDGFPPETVVYPGHGPPTTLGEELTRNPFLADLRREREAAG